ncbi:unnamed protein product [Meloidogyne enterolobii]|uniref:Uncharacterized protein n=1 Tax=Meloidogyne enterolobii TaxID=390850 RepID=A0ACB0YMS7_MELEN
MVTQVENGVVGSGPNRTEDQGFFGSVLRFSFGYPMNFQEPTTLLENNLKINYFSLYKIFILILFSSFN